MRKKPDKILDYYVLVYSPGHERALGSGYVPEHILIAEKILGRQLTADEEVRHINGNTHDNRPVNLEILSSNADYRASAVEIGDSDLERKASNKTFIPCRYQKPCWKTVREPIARANGIYLPYVCSYQTEGDIYRCSRFWTFLDNEMEEKKESE